MGGRGGGSPAQRSATYDYLVSRPWVVSRGLPAPGTPEDRVIRAYSKINGLDGATNFVDIGNLRERTPGLSRAQFDQAIRSLVKSGIAVAAEEEFTPLITKRMASGSIDIGGKARHLVSIGRK